MEYRSMDFNADKVKQYQSLREVMAQKYSSIDVNYFGPESTSSCNTELNFTLANRATLSHVIGS